MAKSDPILVLGAFPDFETSRIWFRTLKISQNHLSFKPQCTPEMSPIVTLLFCTVHAPILHDQSKKIHGNLYLLVRVSQVSCLILETPNLSGHVRPCLSLRLEIKPMALSRLGLFILWLHLGIRISHDVNESSWLNLGLGIVFTSQRLAYRN